MKKIIQLLFILFIFFINTEFVSGDTVEKISIASGIVPHHLLAKEIMEDFFEFIAKKEQHPDTILILSPDHFNSAMLNQDISFITVNWETGNKKILEIPVDVSLLKKMSTNHNVKQNNGAILSEFGITNLLPFIKEYLPDTKVIPFIIPEDISREQVNQLITTIDNIAPSKTLLVASVDFSHYLPLEAAVFHDTKSIRVLLNFEEEHFENIEVDSWQSLYAVRLFAKLRESEKPVIVAHKNSVDFLPYDLNSTTSYFSVIFQEGEPGEKLETETILLTGDMMMGRGVDKLMKENSIYYPFQKIVQLLRGVDIVFTNLEGPVLESPLEFTGNELKLSFHPNVLEGVKWSQINVLSLANNHMMDMEENGFQESIDWLGKYQLHSIGNPLSSYQNNPNPSFSTEHSVFLAFNRILPFINYQEEIIEEIKKAKLHYPEKTIIVSMHWGNEYELTSSHAQKEFAHQVISAGADIIVGHHPHVVQEVELIQGKPVFYSVGNFIFDQQPLSETKEGLIVGLIINADKIICRLFPIKNQSGQPMLMSQGETAIFLHHLAQKSDKRLLKEIEKGIIKLEWKK